MLVKTKSLQMGEKPIVKSFFNISDENSLDEFWSFITKEEGATKSVEFIMHICSEVLYEADEDIVIEFELLRYSLFFIIKSEAFANKALEHYFKIRTFLSIEVDGNVTILKSLRGDDVLSFDFCNAMRDDDPKLALSSAKSLFLAKQRLLDYSFEILKELTDLRKNEDVSLLSSLSLKLFVYSQKLSRENGFKGLSKIMGSISFSLQTFCQKRYEEAKEALTLCEIAVRDIVVKIKSELIIEQNEYSNKISVKS